MNNEFVVNAGLDQLLENLPVGSIKKATGNFLYGINHRQIQTPVPSVRDRYGYVFFTRPQLNMEILNISNHRGFYSLLTDNKNSYNRYTRLMLDPRLCWNGINSGLTSPFVDPNTAFIPLLTNSAVSVSGFPDLVTPTYTSQSGLFGEEISFVDGTVNHYESYDLDCTFRNIRGSPLIYLFYIWEQYQMLMFEGILNRYFDFITENEIDYMTRIYRIVTDQQNKYVTQIACTGASFPLNVPTGSIFDFDIDQPYNLKNSEISIRFRSMGFCAFEDIIKYEFNMAGAIFNPGLRKLLEYDLNNENSDTLRNDFGTVYSNVAGCGMVKIPHELSNVSQQTSVTNIFYNMNFRAYPYINLQTNELEWWVDERVFNQNSADGFKNLVTAGRQVNNMIGD